MRTQALKTVLTLSLTLAGATAMADPVSRHGYADSAIRLHIPLREHGPETLRLGRLMMRERGINPEGYRLQAVVLANGPFSSGYASLKVGNLNTSRFYLPGRERIRIPAPGRADRNWLLRLGPGTQVRAVTLVLEPRHRVAVPRSGHSLSSTSRWQGSPRTGSSLWLVDHSHDDRHSHRKADKKDNRQAGKLKRTRQQLADTAKELEQAERDLERKNKQNKQLKTRNEKLAKEAQLAKAASRPAPPAKARPRDIGELRQAAYRQKQQEKQRRQSSS